jgi:hypothetical protein
VSRRLLALAAALALAVAPACDGEPSGPTPGALKVKITMPQSASGQDAAILFTVTGPAVPASVAPGSGLQAYSQPLALTTKHAVTGTLTTGATILTLNVDDVRQSYTATIQQVATSGYQLRISLTGYSLSVTR